MTLGEKLQRLRRARGWTQEQLAERMGVSRQSLSKWESDAALPDTANVIALADLFGVTTDYLLRKTPREPGERPQENGAQTPAQPQGRGGRMPSRELWAWLMIAAASVGLIVLRICGSLHPVNYGYNDKHYSGFAGFLYGYDLWWALVLLLIVLALGLLLRFGADLCRLGKRFVRWMRRG